MHSCTGNKAIYFTLYSLLIWQTNIMSTFSTLLRRWAPKPRDGLPGREGGSSVSLFDVDGCPGLQMCFWDPLLFCDSSLLSVYPVCFVMFILDI